MACVLLALAVIRHARRESKVSDLYAQVAVQEEVTQLQVAVDHSVLVHVPGGR